MMANFPGNNLLATYMNLLLPGTLSMYLVNDQCIYVPPPFASCTVVLLKCALFLHESCGSLSPTTIDAFLSLSVIVPMKARLHKNNSDDGVAVTTPLHSHATVGGGG